MKIVFLDEKSIGSDIDLSGFERFGTVVKYNIYDPKEVKDKIVDADIIIVNKMPVNEETIGEAKNLKLVCVTATGTNNLDKEYLEKRGIEWRNVAGYSTNSVAQHTFAMLFYLLEKLPYYDDYVKSEKYINDSSFTHFDERFEELAQLTWGIIGLGTIGKKVADIAKLFGCRVIYYSTGGNHDEEGYERCSFDELLEQSDIVSVHAPLNEKTENLMDYSAFKKMKKTAIFLNVGRGPIVVEEDLYRALNEGLIASAGLDVLRKEPMSADNPLKNIKDSKKLLITPHIAWAAVGARVRLMDIIQKQVEEFINQS